MSDTPKTDAAVYLTKGPNFNAVCPNFARDLERENSALKADFRDEVKRHNAAVKMASQEIASLKMKLELSMRDNAALRDSQCTTGHLEKLLAENAALRDLIEDMAHQNCHTGVAPRDYNGQVAGTMVTDSGALSVNGQALRLLAQSNPPRFRIVAEFGRMVVGYWPENDPQKEAQP